MNRRGVGAVDIALLVLLFVDGLIVGIASVAALNQHVGTAAAPIGIAVAAIGNALLVWLASGFADSPWNWLPVIGWGIVVLVAVGTGPGGDVLFVSDWRVAALIVAGIAGPAALVWAAGTRRRIEQAQRG
ncbi:MAG TPA: facilitated glucose transporter [Gordonia sp. (in: high G+C Gram-positive bacteria)]|uniref:facilitated glucose transporter n=1 Tax=unclassified Gordonia (in: high G+C Gram-positive bacteria) TaxID=2657482 RepID=UPI000FA9CEB7|nr:MULTISPECIES: facilitated glucose transporter [unclassified Gordonia (in: high G+C Gram-positive bacteria)]RUP36796.1 MAG: facilitated glucose transporter [Gordonia sp. (in: high G+C Gram-positive bacteria)]HNP58633.1 facilitated glucose transporter [Gordonia sp. (in: high G+C Gram-positive bacteria)]HRC52646.1 facilitated glucose transporter [Gordonia sp. (in: high G+C Gram-positive bacteria)]